MLWCFLCARADVAALFPYREPLKEYTLGKVPYVDCAPVAHHLLVWVTKIDSIKHVPKQEGCFLNDCLSYSKEIL